MADELPLSIDLPIYAGVTFRQQFRWRPDGVTGQDFTGWSGVAQVGTRGGPPAEVLTADNGGLVLGPGGLVTLQVDAVVTAVLPGDSLFYVVDLIDPAGAGRRFVRGWLRMIRDFTP